MVSFFAAFQGVLRLYFISLSSWKKSTWCFVQTGTKRQNTYESSSLLITLTDSIMKNAHHVFACRLELVEVKAKRDWIDLSLKSIKKWITVQFTKALLLNIKLHYAGSSLYGCRTQVLSDVNWCCQSRASSVCFFSNLTNNKRLYNH